MKIVLNIILLSSISSLYASSVSVPVPLVGSCMSPERTASRAAEVTSPLPNPDFPLVFTQSKDSEEGPIVVIERAEEKETEKMQRETSGGHNFFPGKLHSYTVTAGGCCLVIHVKILLKDGLSFIERKIIYDSTGKILRDDSKMHFPVESPEQLV